MAHVRLFALPEDVFTCLVTHWLLFGDIVRLDSAVCLKSARSIYLAALSKITELFPSARLQQVTTEIYFEWLMLRGVSLRILEVYSFQGREKNSFIAQHLSRLASLVLNRSSVKEWFWLEGMLPHCTNLLSIEIRGNQYLNKHMTLLLQWCPKLRRLCVVGEIFDRSFQRYPTNEVLEKLLVTHQALSQIIIINIPVSLALIENCGASGKVIVFAGPFTTHTPSYLQNQRFTISLARPYDICCTQPVYYSNCHQENCLNLLHDHLHNGELCALKFIRYSAVLEPFLWKYASMDHLELDDCTNITEVQLSVLLRAPHLKYLILRSNQTVKSVDFPPLSAGNTFLYTLTLEKFTSFQQEAVGNVLHHCVNLKFLTTREMPQIDRNRLRAICPEDLFLVNY